MALTPTSNNVVKKKVKRANETHTEKEMELNEKLVNVRRITKVVKGGRRFRFSALVVVGDGKGKIGFGNGKAKEIPDAVKKATHHAKSNMVHIPMREGRTLHHDVKGKFGAGKVIIRSANKGTGVIAGGAMRAIFEAMGIQDVVAKSIGSSNPDNLVRATIDALKFISSPRTVALFRDKKVGEIFAKLHNNQTIDDSEEIKMDKNTVEINKEEE